MCPWVGPLVAPCFFCCLEVLGLFGCVGFGGGGLVGLVGVVVLGGLFVCVWGCWAVVF